MKRWMVKSRRIFAPLLMAVMLLSLFDVTDGRGSISLAAQAADEESAGLLESGSCGTSANWEFYSDGTLQITGTGEMSFNTAPWEDYRKKISKVIFDEGITNIAGNAFYNCSSLTGIQVPSGVTSIGDGAFRGCTGLERIVVAEGNTIYDSRDNCNAIIETSSNTLITGCKNTVIPSGVTSIGDEAFRNCSGLIGITIPDSVTSIGYSAFFECSSLTGIKIPSGVTTIGYYAFQGCSGLERIEVEEGNSNYDSRDNCNAIIETSSNTLIAGCKNTVIPPGVTEIRDYAFKGCTSLTSIKIPDSVKSIGDEAFQGCTSLTSIEIPSGVTSIKSKVFYGCSGLTSIEIPSGVTTIGYSAFYECSGLTGIEIPSGVTTIGYYAFQGCSGLERIEVEEGNSNYDSRDNCNAIIETSSNTLLTGCKNTIIPSGVTSIGNQAFCNCTSLTSIEIPSGVTEIGNYAFDGCTSLTSIEISDSVTSLGDTVFYGCSGLKRIVVAEGNTVYDSRDNCNAIINTSSNELVVGCNDTVIPSGVTSIGDAAFQSCSGLASITIPDSVTSIGDFAFYECSGLESIVVAEGNTVYDSRDNCNAIIEKSSNTLITGCKNTVIPSDVTSIGDSAFCGCSGLKSIEIPASVTSIGDSAFDGCNDLTIYALPGSYAEDYAKNMEGISSKIMRFDVQFVSDGQIIDTQSVEYGKAAESPEVVKEGYTFSKWDKDFTEIKEDTTVNAVWTINEYQVTFKDGDAVLGTQTVEYGKAATAPTVAPKEGYTFSWDKDFAKIKEDTTVNAVWTINEYQVTFKDGDTVLGVQEIEYGKAATAPTVPAKEGYTLSWDKEFTEIKEDTTVNAVWIINKYQVTFKDGDKVLDTQEVEYGKAATAPVVAPKEGYTLSWDKEFTEIKADTTVNTVWTAKKNQDQDNQNQNQNLTNENMTGNTKQPANQYTVQFDKNGGSKVSKPSITVTYNDKYGALPAAVRKKYTFLGWYTAKSGGNKITPFTEVSAAEDHTLYAHWTKVKTKKASIKKVTAKKKKMTVKFGKVSGAKGYQIVYSANKKFKSAKKVRVTSTRAVIKKLKSKRTIYVKVRAYKMDSAGSKVYGKFSSVKRVKIK